MIVGQEVIDLIRNRALLQVGTDGSLSMRPELIHWIEVGTALGQPQKLNVEVLRQRARRCGGVDRTLIQEQRHRPAWVMVVHLIQELQKIFLSLSGLLQKEQVAGAQMQGAEDRSPGVDPGDQDRSPLAPEPPSRTQRWKEQKIGFVFGQESRFPGQSADLGQNFAFFFSS